ncbi:selenium metabolism-associated LysR family transcriptional regulator [Paenibacillus taichungensis]|uniref:LysR family transcriptional regulator n=1 Tax=Paenibacillus taichungensis TaxID=484184 RepID=A0ABX2MT99_9BACL|nr:MULTISPECIES: selenium metabolism-associated LysR family transcriptional regulator [Paenibacillus]OME84809.1 LysR family transcriptional regulator [Paenibacillus pabuli]MDR9747022.1 selenium metabolism-associated LysR family transcriptional regulator [Paenibacillus taichungensis]MEC0108213.1 selenium metabolism-associated LysR family transcriptional regulator [Paenibacillus taichungensis]MEC0199741.1 selenium metabolism-associated LysR family transcriptional regulator [Paenibacillus taichung
MNFHQLHIFYTVAEKGSFSAAAQALHMTQPAVTMQIQSLEDYFGTKLLHRSTKKIELSEAGRTLLPHAKRSVELVRQTDEAMSAFTQMLQGRLQLGASLTIGEYVLPRMLGPFARQYPDISIVMKVMNTTQIMDDILKHQLNFGLIEAPVHHPDMIVEPVMQDELKLVVPAGHALADRGEVELEDVLSYAFVLREKGSGTRQVMEDQLQKRNIDPQDMNVVMELGSTGAVKSAVEAGVGITMLSPSSVQHELALGLVHIVDIRGLEFKRQFYAIHLKSSLLPLSAVAFLNYLRQHEQTTSEGRAE